MMENNDAENRVLREILHFVKASATSREEIPESKQVETLEVIIMREINAGKGFK